MASCRVHFHALRFHLLMFLILDLFDLGCCLIAFKPESDAELGAVQTPNLCLHLIEKNQSASKNLAEVTFLKR